MISQAEHDEMAGSILITDSRELAEQVREQLAVQTAAAPRRDVIEASLKNRGMILLVRNLEEGVEMANAYAPEHMEICTAEPMGFVSRIRCAGAIFVGQYSPEPLGDYMAGPNHVLPTGEAHGFLPPWGGRFHQEDEPHLHDQRRDDGTGGGCDRLCRGRKAVWSRASGSAPVSGRKE